MEPLPFSLKHLPFTVDSTYVSTQESTPRHGRGSAGAMPSESSASRCARIQKWAAGHGKALSCQEFAASLDGGQVGGELMEIFRETPEFGKSLSVRLAPFLDEGAEGRLTLIGGGGEAVVFYEEGSQHVIKLFAPPCKARFGWIMTMNGDVPVGIRPGNLDEVLLRFSWFEELFPSGLEMEAVGMELDFLLLRQPFIVGEHPTVEALHRWMVEQGWRKISPPAEVQVVGELTWQRDEWLATDVRPENALVSDYDGQLRVIDFIVHRI
jgi:hypothetical protein